MNPNVTWPVAAFVVLSVLSVSGQSTVPGLHRASPGVNGWFRFASDGYYDPVSEVTNIYIVEASADLSNWVELARLHRVKPQVRDPGRSDTLLIPTLEGEMRADVGDWIIRGIAGEYYPCKPDIFADSYEPVEEP